MLLRIMTSSSADDSVSLRFPRLAPSSEGQDPQNCLSLSRRCQWPVPVASLSATAVPSMHSTVISVAFARAWHTLLVLSTVFLVIQPASSLHLSTYVYQYIHFAALFCHCGRHIRLDALRCGTLLLAGCIGALTGKVQFHSVRGRLNPGIRVVRAATSIFLPGPARALCSLIASVS